MKPGIALAAALSIGALASASASASQPYAGQDDRSIKALSSEQTTGLKEGSGLGYAKAAELNGWPGPLHALELQAELALSADQIDRMQALRQAMLDAAVPLGQALIQAEAALDRLFAGDAPTPAAVAAATEAIALIEGQLRAAHLVAHSAARPVLTPHQRMIYAELRGYGAAPGKGHGHHR